MKRLSADEGPGPPRAFRVAELARSLRVPRATLYTWIKTGQLPAVAVGKVLVILQDDLEHFLMNNRRGGSSSNFVSTQRHS
jgi:excisionase family DNA binding protein